MSVHRSILDNEIAGLVQLRSAQPFEVVAAVLRLPVGIEIMGVALEVRRLYVAVFALPFNVEINRGRLTVFFYLRDGAEYDGQAVGNIACGKYDEVETPPNASLISLQITESV